MPKALSISIVIPAYNSGPHLSRCLTALLASTCKPLEIIVVDDGSKDGTRETAASFGARILSTGRRRGPAFARNLGAKAAGGDVLFFLDSDVCVRPDTLLKMSESFEADQELDALIGSYDSTPECQDFLSQYRNLMHSYVHHTGAQQASTFWSGCGAIRRILFLEHSGFNEKYGRPAIEDIELGYRLSRAGRKIVLDRSIQVTHLKRWTFWGIVRTDILDRGIPWTELILRDRYMPDDLNIQLSQRVSVALVFILVGLACAIAALSGGYLLVLLFAVVFLMLARWWVELGNSSRPRRAYVMFNCMLALLIVLAYTHRMFGLIPPLIVSPALLLVRHRYQRPGIRKSLRWLGIFYVACAVCVSALYLPNHRLVFACVTVLALLGLLNSQFYIFLAGKRGVPFMLAAIPFHLLYHFYNGLSFIIGFVRFYFTTSAQKSQSSAPPAAPRPPPWTAT